MWLKISSVQTFCFLSSSVTTFPSSRKCKNFNFSLYNVPAEMLYLQKYLTNFQKLFFGWKIMKVAIVVEKFKVNRYFCFAIATLPLFQHPENVKISISPFRMSQQKCWIFKRIWRIFKNFLLAERWGRWLLWLKISSAQTFCFSNSNVTNFPSSRKCKNFNFSLYNVPTGMLYLQKYLTNF